MVRQSGDSLNSARGRLRVLYLTRTGLAEPLGQSQVLAYLRGLSQDFSITVVSFERASDLGDRERMAAIELECGNLGIRWLPQRYRSRPKPMAQVLNVLWLIWLTYREVRQGASLIHARSYIPATAALAIHHVSGVPFIFDMRALWPEELIAAGRLRRDSLVHRLVSWVERRCLARGEVVSLTQAAAVYLREKYPAELAGKPIHVIPTCVDMQRFMPGEPPQSFRLGCNGSVLSGWFKLDWLALFFKVAAAQDSAACFEIVTREDPQDVMQALSGAGVPAERIKVFMVAPRGMPGVIQAQSASVMFFTQGLGKLGSSPTRMAEALACGRPVVANEGVGDVAKVLRQYRVGVLVKAGDEAEMARAFTELKALMADEGLRARCRQAVEELFSLDVGTDAYRSIYRTLCRQDTPTAPGGLGV